MPRFTRDNFDPLRVLESLKSGNLTIGEVERLLEESCHAIQRDRIRLTNARIITDNLQRELAE